MIMSSISSALNTFSSPRGVNPILSSKSFSLLKPFSRRFFPPSGGFSHREGRQFLMNENDLFEKALARVKNRFLLCMLIARRLAQIKKSSPPLIEEPSENLEETVLREIIAGKLQYEMKDRVIAPEGASEEFEGEFQGGAPEEE